MKKRPLLRFAHRLSRDTGWDVDDPGRLIRRCGVKGFRTWMAFYNLEPIGFYIENERHIDAAAWSGIKNARRAVGYKPRRVGPMTEEDIRETQREAGY